MDHPPTTNGAASLAQAVFDSIPDPLVVLDAQLRIVASSRTFRTVFGDDPLMGNGSNLFELFGSKWDFPELRRLLAEVAAGESEAVHRAVEHEPNHGNGTRLFSAKRIHESDAQSVTILLSITDISEQRSIERERQAVLEHAEELLRQQSIMLREMEHRVANSLAIIASILLLKAKAVSSEESRLHLQDAHKRVLSVAEVQRHLRPAGEIDRIEVSDYLDKLCAGLARSMIQDEAKMIIKVMAEQGVVGSSDAVSLGLVVTELVINAIKHAFPDERSDALILVTYERDDMDWKLVVSDNGIGKPEGSDGAMGLGTTIIGALAKRLEATVEARNNHGGFSVALTRATFASRMPRAS